MRIVHVVEAWHGGIASYVQALIQAQHQDGHNVVLVADKALFGADPRTLPCTVEFYTSSRNPWRFFRVALELSGIISAQHADVVHAHSTFPGVYTRFPRPLHPRIIYTPHGWSFLKADSTWWLRAIYARVEAHLARRAQAIICMSFMELRKGAQVGIARDRLRMIHTGIADVGRKDVRHGPVGTGGGYEQPDFQEPSAGGHEPLAVGFFGRLDFLKGADLLAGLGGKLCPWVTVHVYGAAASGEDFCGTHPQVIQHGWVSHDELASCMAQMDVVIIPSRSEGFSLVALESLRAGVPIVASGCTSLTEVVIHGYNGLIMQEYSAAHLAGMLNSLSREACHRMGHNAREVYEKAFTFDQYYARMMAVYDDVVKAPDGC